LQQNSVEQKVKKQGEGEKQKKRVKAREREIEIRRRQIKKIRRAKDTVQPTHCRRELKCFTFSIPCISIQFL